MINFLRSFFARREDKGLVGYRCPKCDHFFLIPSEIVQDFSPGGKEYHEGGESYFNCPRCREFVNVEEPIS